MSNFLSQFTSFSGWFLGMQGSSVFTSLPGLLGPTQEGAQPLFKQAPVAYVNCVSPLAWDFIDFLCKSRHISLSSLLYSLNCKFFPYVSLHIYSPFASPFKLWIPWMQLGKDPGKGPFPCLVGKGIQAFPSHLQRKWSQLDTREELQVSCQHFKRPRYHRALQIQLTELHWLEGHTEDWLKTGWQV